MSYNPVNIPTVGPAGGINAITGLVEEWQKKQEEQKRLSGYNDAVVQHAKAAGLISPDEFNKYNAASLTQKTGIAAGYAANLHEDMQRQQMAEQKDYHNATLDNAIEVAKIHAAATGDGAGGPFNPEQITLPPPADAPPGTPPVVVYRSTRHQVLPNPNIQQSFKPAAGAPAIVDGEVIGVWNANGTITKKNAKGNADLIKDIFGGGSAPSTFDAGGGNAPAPPTGAGKVLDPATAKAFLDKAGGDKVKARAAAKEAGYSF